MFRTMRRYKQRISGEECIRILQEEKRGILSVHGEDGYPYGIPMNHWYNPEDGKLYFHGAKTGHKIDAIAKTTASATASMTPDTGRKANGR